MELNIRNTPPVNILNNGDFSVWGNGDGPSQLAYPDGWKFGGNERFTKELTIKRSGTCSLKMENFALGVIGEIYQNIFSPEAWIHGQQWNPIDWNGKTVTFSAWVYATIPNRVRLVLNDDITQTFSEYHPGDSEWRRMSVTKNLSLKSLAFQVAFFIGIGPSTAAYFDSAVLVEGSDPVSTAPATSDASGNAGDISWDADFLYIAVGANTWKRVALSTW